MNTSAPTDEPARAFSFISTASEIPQYMSNNFKSFLYW